MQLFFYRRQFARHSVCSSLIVSIDRVNAELLLYGNITDGNQKIISKQKHVAVWPVNGNPIFSVFFGVRFFGF